MASVHVDADYEKYQSGVVSNLIATTGIVLPTVNSTVVKPEKIVVQALHTNDGVIIVGQNALLPEDGSNGGYILAPGQMQILSGRNVSSWYIAGSGAGGQKCIVTYLSGAN